MWSVRAQPVNMETIRVQVGLERGTMKRLTTLFLCIAGLGCVNDNVSIFIEGVIPPMKEDDGCTWDPSTTSVLLSPGLFNVEADLILGTAAPYTTVLAVNSQLQPRGGSGRSETNGVQVERAEVTIRSLSGDAIDFGGLPNPFSIPTTGYIPPSSDPTQPGESAVSVVAIPGDYAIRLAAMRDGGGNLLFTQVLASIRLVGKTLGHIDIETGEWDWPITLCDGLCLFQCATADDTRSFSCLPGQDGRSTIDSGISGVCP